MAGTPILNKLIADVEKAGGIEAIIDRVANGETIQRISQDFGVSRNFLSGYVNKQPRHKAAFIRARQERAEVRAEEALDLADNVDKDPNAINKVRSQIDVRKWLAGIDDPERFGPKGTGVTITVGALHLDALRKVQSELSAPDVIEGSAEEVDNGDNT